MQYTLTELIQKDDFIDWVLHPSTDSDAYWLAYSSGSDQNGRTVAAARGYVSLLAEDTGRQKPSPAQSEQMWQVIKENITHENYPRLTATSSSNIDHQIGKRTPLRTGSFKRKWQFAASVVALLAFSTAAYRFYHSQRNVIVAESAAPVLSRPEMMVRHNTTQKPMTVFLPDGSSVVVLPGGRIDYQSKNTPGNRSVTLVGTAFFEIKKDKSRPFYVFTDGIATKVLGTSFLIDAPIGTDQVKVEVKTGRVSVFRANKLQAFAMDNMIEGLPTVLTPNQKSAFSRSNGQQIKLSELNAQSEAVKPDALIDQSFAFDETPVTEVFDALQRSYNIPIHFNRTLLKGCTLNATLVGEPFSKKLSVICAALGTEFKIIDDEVFITGKACQ